MSANAHILVPSTTIKWKASIKEYQTYLRLEKSLSENSIAAYGRDLLKLSNFSAHEDFNKTPTEITADDLSNFILTLVDLQLESRSQARLISTIRGFYTFLFIQNLIEQSPAERLEAPRLAKKIPEYLTEIEINELFDTIDLSTQSGHRDRAIFETLYACGLRVSELTSLKISNLDLDNEIIKVVGKGNRERLVPINLSAIHYIRLYLSDFRKHQKVSTKGEDVLFLNLRGGPLSRISIFNLVKKASAEIGLKKNISPHTFRHSFATHLYQRGADLRAIQDMLGHRSILTTEIYAHASPIHLKKTMELYHPRFQTNE